MTLRILTLAVLALMSFPALAQSPQGTLECKFTGTDFVYDCKIKLTHAGAPLPGVDVTVGADMPSMPMAHNVKPVKAKPGAAPGEYDARLELEMTGPWAVKLRLGGAVRDQLILHYDFDDKGARPSKRAGGHHHGK